MGSFGGGHTFASERMIEILDRRAGAELYKPYRAFLLNIIKKAPPGLMVDIGAGGGHLVEKVGTFRGAVGVEPSVPLATHAKKHNRNTLIADGASLPFRTSSVAVCTSERVLQHLPQQNLILAEMVRITMLGGLIVVADPDHTKVQIETTISETTSTAVHQWWHHHGVANPTGALEVASTLHQHGWETRTYTFDCITRNYLHARAIRNFASWAQKAQQQGVGIADKQVHEWEEFWQHAENSSQPFTLHWPILLTVGQHR